ncbi:uncharacterized protein LOC106476530 isoform X2 [Limulus polyphemus]|nr:uncharacterized protein LOC106476530 isoform X2 [Limulus polyphemus]
MDLLCERTELPNSRDKQTIVQTGDQCCQTENNISSVGPKSPCNRHSFLQTINGVISLQSHEKQESKDQTRDTSIIISASQSNACMNENINDQNRSGETTAKNVPVSGTNNSRCQDEASGVDPNVNGSQDPISNINQMSLEPVSEIDGVQSMDLSGNDENTPSVSLIMNIETVSNGNEEVLLNVNCEEQLTEAINNDIIISEALVAEEEGRETNLDQEDLYDVPRQPIRPVEVGSVAPPNCNTIDNLNMCSTNEPVGSNNNDEASSSYQSSDECSDVNVTNDISENDLLAGSESTVPTSPKVVEPATTSVLTHVEVNIDDGISIEPVCESNDICLQSGLNQPQRVPSTEVAVQPELRSPRDSGDEQNSGQENHNISTHTHIPEICVTYNQETGDNNVTTVEEHASHGNNLHERSQTANVIDSNPYVLMYAPTIESTLLSDLEDEDVRPTPPPSYEEVVLDPELNESSYNLLYGTI